MKKIVETNTSFTNLPIDLIRLINFCRCSPHTCFFLLVIPVNINLILQIASLEEELSAKNRAFKLLEEKIKTQDDYEEIKRELG